jgi:hypothetical protein
MGANPVVTDRITGMKAMAIPIRTNRATMCIEKQDGNRQLGCGLHAAGIRIAYPALNSGIKWGHAGDVLIGR